VVALIASGLSNDEISRKIYVSAATAKTHAARAMTKLGARDRAQLVVFAYQAGLVRPGWADRPPSRSGRENGAWTHARRPPRRTR
jgi:hypothetical protein